MGSLELRPLPYPVEVEPSASARIHVQCREQAHVQCRFELREGRDGVTWGSNEWATSGYETGPPPSDGGEERPTKGPPDGKGFEYICVHQKGGGEARGGRPPYM